MVATSKFCAILRTATPEYLTESRLEETENAILKIQNEFADAYHNLLPSRNMPIRTGEQQKANNFQLNNQWYNRQNKQPLPAI